MKVFLLLFPIIASSLARPEIGIEKKFETSREISAQQLTPLIDSAHLPEIIETNDQMRTPKDRQIFFEGAQIPVQLIYESDDGETEAIVKEVSVESIFKKPQGKVLNRVERSDTSNNGHLDDGTLEKKLIKADATDEDFALRGQSNSELLPHNIEEIFGSEGEQFPVDADELNKGLGIEGRHRHKGIESLNISPARKVSPLDYNYNVVKEMIKNINNNDKNNGVRRTIQHFQSLLHSGKFSPTPPLEQSAYNIYENKPKIMKVISYYPVVSSVAVPPLQDKISTNEKVLDDYFPFVVNNPFNSMWSALTNIVEYGPQADICKTENKAKRKKREVEDEPIIIPQSVLDDLSRHHSGFGLMRPNIMKLKVRRGGIAIAGPGGIATAGSGGTTIVGPGGTALTPPDATAVVGPGGRVIHIPSFDASELKSRTVDLSEVIKHGKVVAHGPVVLYNTSPMLESL